MMPNQFILTPYYIDEAQDGLEKITQEGWWLNKMKLPAGSRQSRMVEIYKPLKDMTAMAVSQGKRPVSIAGDCCTSLAVLSGLQHSGIDPLLLWLDAHGDFNTWEATPSGFLGGMPLAMMVGRGEQTIVEGVMMKNIPEEDVILCDGRDLDFEESIALNSSAINLLKELPGSAEFLPEDQPLYLHFDTDFINPEEAPAMNYPAPGGPSVEQIRSFFHNVAQSDRVAAVSVSAWNPDLDVNGETAKVVLDLVHTLLIEESGRF